MRDLRTSLCVLLVGFIAIIGGGATAPAGQAPVSPPPGFSEWRTSEGCVAFVQGELRDDATVSWDGACERGRIAGQGTLTQRYPTITWTYTGRAVNGFHDGQWQARASGAFRDGRPVDSTPFMVNWSMGCPANMSSNCTPGDRSANYALQSSPVTAAPTMTGAAPSLIQECVPGPGYCASICNCRLNPGSAGTEVCPTLEAAYQAVHTCNTRTFDDEVRRLGQRR